ncbi:MAG: hypothetical protein ACR2OE_04085 [Thermomicrobiales bacterium]
MSTLKELLKDSYTLDYDDYPRWSLSLSDLDRAEAKLTAPLRAEIATLRDRVFDQLILSAEATGLTLYLPSEKGDADTGETLLEWIQTEQEQGR